jgi:protein tyrosine phosphatase (PTP) superfamily phosphohydrolase (DUF442 family)
MSGPSRRWIRRGLAALVAAPLLYLLVLAAPYFHSKLFEHNFHVVVPGRLYRSAEMSGEDLGRLIDAHGIQSVLDLRLSGDEPGSDGVTEGDVAARHGAQYRNVSMTSSRASQRTRILRLLDAFDELPTPILVHCTSGSERSGVASAIWLMEKEHRAPDEAAGQLALRYGFNAVERDLRSFFQGEPTLDRIVSAYAEARKTRDVSFREWVSAAPLTADKKK